MATPDRTPAEEQLRRGGPQLTARDAREVAADAGTVPGVGTPTTSDREVHGSITRDQDQGVGGAPRGASGSTGNDVRGERMPDEAPYGMSQTALGDADAVQKTSYGVGMGTETDGRLEHAPVGLRKGEGTVVGRTGPGGGINPVAWIVGLLAVIAAVVYGAGMLTG
jgi:hypothetical protein